MTLFTGIAEEDGIETARDVGRRNGGDMVEAAWDVEGDEIQASGDGVHQRPLVVVVADE